MPRRLLTALAFALLLPAAAVVLPPAAVRADDTPRTASEEERAEIRALVEELREEAARIRGLAWKHEVPADLLTREELRANMEKEIEDELEPEEYARDVRVLRRLRLLGPDEDPLQLQLEMMGEMVAGYYHPKDKRLFLIEGMTGDAQRPVILHELIHALEDQHVDLVSRVEPYEDDGDRVFAEKCIEEGSAEHASALYQAAHPDIAQKFNAEQATPAAMARQMRVLTRVPAFLILSTLLHYQTGPEFVARAVGDDYPGGMAALYETPPMTQEQVLHPERWLGDMQDWPRRITVDEGLAPAYGEGWAELDRGPVGELDLATYLDFFLGGTRGKLNLMRMSQGQYVHPRARVASEGWDGGLSVIFAQGDGPISILQAMAFDSVEDATEAADALVDALKAAYGAAGETAWTPGADGDATAARTAELAGPDGPVRVHQRGDRVIVLDGGPEGAYEAVWEHALATHFERDERDTWDPALVPDPFEGCTFADRESGLGLRLPSEAWSAEVARGRPGLVASLRHAEEPGLRGQVSLVPLGSAMVVPMVETQLAREHPGAVEGRTELRLPAGAGYRYEGPGMVIAVFGRGRATVLVRVDLPPGASDAVRAELDGLLEGVVVAE